MRTVQSWTCELGYGADTMFHRTYFLFQIFLGHITDCLRGDADIQREIKNMLVTQKELPLPRYNPSVTLPLPR